MTSRSDVALGGRQKIALLAVSTMQTSRADDAIRLRAETLASASSAEHVDPARPLISERATDDGRRAHRHELAKPWDRRFETRSAVQPERAAARDADDRRRARGAAETMFARRRRRPHRASFSPRAPRGRGAPTTSDHAAATIATRRRRVRRPRRARARRAVTSRRRPPTISAGRSAGLAAVSRRETTRSMRARRAPESRPVRAARARWTELAERGPSSAPSAPKLEAVALSPRDRDLDRSTSARARRRRRARAPHRRARRRGRAARHRCAASVRDEPSLCVERIYSAADEPSRFSAERAPGSGLERRESASSASASPARRPGGERGRDLRGRAPSP